MTRTLTIYPKSRDGRSGTELNIERCKKMIAEGRMTEAGLKVMPK